MAGRVQPAPVDWRPFLIVAGVSAALILWLGRDLSFFNDDCDFLARTWSAEGIFGLHNGHPAVIPSALWLATESLFGTGSYLPYHALVVIAHVAFAAAVYVLFQPRGSVPALAAASLALLMGLAWENIYWASAVGFVISAAAGLWALIVKRRVLAIALLGVSILSSAMGAPFIAAALAIRWPLAAAGVGIAVEYGLVIAAGRTDLAVSRYLHSTGAFVFLAAASIPWPPRAVVVTAYAVALAVNVVHLIGGPSSFQAYAQMGFACVPYTNR